MTGPGTGRPAVPAAGPPGGGSGGVAGIVLAAGAGTRFGGPKALVWLDGERLVDRAVATLRGGGCDPVVVVQGAAPLGAVDARVLPNRDWATGMGSSLRVALRHLAGTVAAAPGAGLVVAGDAGATAAAAGAGPVAAVVLLVDTPWVGAGAVARLVSASAGGCLAAQATYAGRPGHPVLLARGAWEAVAADAVGDRGARAWLRAHRDLVLDVPCDGTGDPRDVDVPADLTSPPT
jgi:CTP:molybdopterin cytidylyltransferase MocA